MASELDAQNTDQINTTKRGQKAQKGLTSLREFLDKFNNDWAMMFAGSLAYSLLTAIVPILLALLSVLGFILGPSTVDYITSHLTSGSNQILNQAVTEQLKMVLTQLRREAGLLALIAILTAVFGGSRLFLGLEGCLDIIYRVRPRKIIGQNVMAILMMIVFIILVPIMIFAATLPGFIQSFIASNTVFRQIPIVNTIANNGLSIWLAGFTGGLLAAFLLFWAIYIIVPNQRIKMSRSWQGALVSALALELFITIVFPLYVTHFMGNYTGQAGLVVILLIFFYYFAVILLLGAEVNAYFFEKVRPLPNDLATFVSTMGGILNKDISEIEAPSHVDPKPTEKADRGHVAEARLEEQANQQKNVQKQKAIVEKELAKDRQQKQRSRKGWWGNARPHSSHQPMSRSQTVLSVLIGSTLAMGIELLRHKQRGH
jgi:YihY family inner membrane protein